MMLCIINQSLTGRRPLGHRLPFPRSLNWDKFPMMLVRAHEWFMAVNLGWAKWPSLLLSFANLLSCFTFVQWICPVFGFYGILRNFC